MRTNRQARPAASHTLPPWSVEHDSRVDLDGNDIWRVIAPNANQTGGHLIATVNTGWGDHEANARLIAAAPELLAAASNLLRHIRAATELRKLVADVCPQASENLYAAITKAGGAA